VASEQVSIILGKGTIITFQERIGGDVFEMIRSRIRNNKGRIRKVKADYLAYSLIDAIVDNYFLILENIGSMISFIEEEMIADPSPEVMHFIHELKRDILFLRKSVWPLREVINNMQKSESTLLTHTTFIYMRDVYDHTIQVIDTVEVYRDMLAGLVDIYLSSLSNKVNEVMKFLTIIATIFIPLTLVAGVYGMNFKFMPELETRWGYFAVIGFMASVGITMLAYFKRKKWL
jgi:magnesium transporter